MGSSLDQQLILLVALVILFILFRNLAFIYASLTLGYGRFKFSASIIGGRIKRHKFPNKEDIVSRLW